MSTSPDELGPAWDRRWPPTGPRVLDVRIDPNVPPIPPHATFEQAKDAAKAMLKGDEDRAQRDRGGYQDQGAGVPAAYR